MAKSISLIALLQDSQNQLVFLLFYGKLSMCPGPKITAKIFKVTQHTYYSIYAHN